jgi:hypothetical protein
MNSARDDIRLRMPGYPIRKSPDQSLLGGSPKLIAASHVLHRLPAPRHPPCALSSLTTKGHESHIKAPQTTLEDTLLFSCQRPDRHPVPADAMERARRLQRPDYSPGPARYSLVERTGIEPATPGLQSRCSPN